MPRSDESPVVERVVRFGAFERALHWVNALLMLELLATGLTLYGFPGTTWVGNRLLVKDLHIWAGWALPVVLIVAFAAPFGHAVRSDARRIARWTADDRRWWRRSTRHTARIGKFNPGQKLNAVLTVGSVPVMFVTGMLMRYPDLAAVRWRTGADVTHRWFAFALLALIAGHIVVSIAHPEALRGILRGRVRGEWALRHHPRWYLEVRPANGSEGHDTPS